MIELIGGELTSRLCAVNGYALFSGSVNLSDLQRITFLNPGFMPVIPQCFHQMTTCLHHSFIQLTVDHNL